jgi:hypothetical protein
MEEVDAGKAEVFLKHIDYLSSIQERYSRRWRESSPARTTHSNQERDLRERQEPEHGSQQQGSADDDNPEYWLV